MQFEILDKKKEKSSTCYLVKATLQDYLSILPKDYDSYEIQRSIVSNAYLDRLVNTVLTKSHIPIITLVSESAKQNKDELKLPSFNILDGLQRTHRLRIINDTRSLFLKKVRKEGDDISDFQLKRKYRHELKSIGSTGNILLAIREFYGDYGEHELDHCFSDNYQWFEVWKGLTPEAQVRKMLLLNAGHKSVNIKHQLELLFQNLLPLIQKASEENITITREKESSSTKYSKGRELGNYHFAHLISSLVSFIEEEPISTNSTFIEKIQNEDMKLNAFVDRFTYSFLSMFIDSIYKIDVAAEKSFGDAGIRWIGREVSLVALFAAIGKHCDDSKDIKNISRKIETNFSKCNLNDYEECRNNVDLARVNIGNINRKFIFRAFDQFIGEGCSRNINWKEIFAEGSQ
jgi:hypothetical protein